MKTFMKTVFNKEFQELIELLREEGIKFRPALGLSKGLQLIMPRREGRLVIFLSKKDELYDMSAIYLEDNIENDITDVFMGECDNRDIETIVSNIKGYIKQMEDTEKTVDHIRKQFLEMSSK
ncbi:hypothetical protein ABEY41_19165 [Peribacillus butanolivorans]|uniref:hypothetical protein n=1 Tax=Peribacillus butanolivorans TaxID=421767 RepID=UPI003D268721